MTQSRRHFTDEFKREAVRLTEQPFKSEQQQEIEQLRRELAKVKTERDILKKRSDTLPGTRHEVSIHLPSSDGLVGQ